MKDNALTPLGSKGIRKIWHNEEWYFSIVDVVEILTDSPLPRQYWNRVKKNLIAESQSYPFWIQLKLKASDNKNYLTDCANTEGVFRIIMSVPSPKAEPLRLWLAEQGKRTIAIKGGKTAGEAREKVEAATGKKVVSSENFLKPTEKG